MSRNRRVQSKLIVAAFTLASLFFLFPFTTYAGFLYLLNDDSTGNRIYGFQVNESTGQLTALAGFPVNAMIGGINNIVSERMIVDKVNGRLYVINEGSDTVSAYTIDRTSGALTAMPFSPISLGSGVWNTIAVHSSGSPLVISNNATNGVAQSFNITASTATPAAGSPFLVSGAAGFSSTFSTDGNYFYVGGNIGTTIAGFSVTQATGVLTPLPGTPFNAVGTSPLAYGVDTAGRLFAVDNANGIRVFTSASGVLSPVTGNPFASGLTQRRFGLVHHNQNFYIVAGNTGNNVGVYQIAGSGAGTTATPVAGSPFATGGTTANALALNDAGTFLFVANRVSRNVTTFAFNPSTGALTGQTVLPSNTLGTVGAINGIGYLPDVTVSNAEIAGRVTDMATGQGLPRVYVRLTNMSTMTSVLGITNGFGYYSFPAVPTGATYTLTPVAKIYSFSPPSITFSHVGDVTNQNFTGMQSP